VTAAVMARLGTAVIAGGILGVDRELRHKPAGIRLHALVALGAAIVTVIGVQLASAGPTMDASTVTRVVQGTVTAVGFLGGGVIVRDGGGSGEAGAVRGLTTAASIWLSACLGIAAGAGLWPVLMGGVLFTVVILVGGARLGRALHRWWHPHETS
jgi:putative Mg2+ transporter-C (MgtC) family protein